MNIDQKLGTTIWREAPKEYRPPRSSLNYIEEVAAHRQPNEIITVVVPQFVPRHWWNNLLHTQTAIQLRLVLLFKPGIIVTDVPYHVE